MLEQGFRFPCGMTARNRIAKAAMTEKLAGPDGVPNSLHVRLYERFAAGGAGFILTGNVVIDSRFLEALGNVVLEEDGALDSFAAWARAGRSCEAPMVMQINHPGRQTPRTVSDHSLAPSAVPLRMKRFFSEPREMGESEIQDVIERFRRAARIAEQAGFSGVEIHAAHGYLVSQFLSPRVNRRTDHWGGGVRNRARLLVEIVERVRASVSSGFGVGVKLNSEDYIKGGLTRADSLEVVRFLSSVGLDFLEISGGTHEQAASFGYGLDRRREGYFLDYARQARELAKMPLILTGGVRTTAFIESALRDGLCDLVGLARPLALEPDLPTRLVNGSAQGAREVQLRLPAGPRAGLAELAWYREQLLRMGKNREPKRHASAKLALLRMVIAELHKARLRRRHIGTLKAQTAVRARLGALP